MIEHASQDYIDGYEVHYAPPSYIFRLTIRSYEARYAHYNFVHPHLRIFQSGQTERFEVESITGFFPPQVSWIPFIQEIRP